MFAIQSKAEHDCRNLTAARKVGQDFLPYGNVKFSANKPSCISSHKNITIKAPKNDTGIGKNPEPLSNFIGRVSPDFCGGAVCMGGGRS